MRKIMTKVVLACEVLRHEIEKLMAEMQEALPVTFLEQKLHDNVDVLRSKVQETVDALEQEYQGDLTILCAYALCGRALCGVRASRATMVFPRLHDCIPLLLGLKQKEFSSTYSGAVYWLSPGFLQGSIFSPQLSIEALKRFAEYEKKYGPAKAARLMEAEKRMMQSYTKACHIRWPEMGDTYVEDAKKLASSVPLPYDEVQGSSGYLAALLQGGLDHDKFLHLAPGQTIDMDMDGSICAVAV